LILDLDDLALVSEQPELGPKARALGAVADGLTLGNRALAEQYPGRPWWWVPTCIEPAEWPVPDRAARTGPPVLGWVGTPGNLTNLEPLAPVLAELCERYRTKVRVVCSEPAELPGVPQEFVCWAAAGEQSDLEPMDIGLAPLLDAPLQRHKCGLKALQYMASGMPVVASPVGALRDIVADGESGLLASSAGEWRQRLERLIGNDELRLRLGAQARRCVEERWSFAAHESSFEDAARGVRHRGSV
jgi:glycosyltransferase involved in cell wall biosynthesis